MAHRTQQQRSETTRIALMDATVALLAEIGYARVTTQAVADRAQVSRGAQTHHFPAKQDLVVASVEHLVDQITEEFAASLSRLGTQDRTLSFVIREVWPVVSGPRYAALLEVVVASRTDPALRVVVHAVSAKLDAAVVPLFRDLVPSLGDEDRARILIGTIMAFLQGAAISAEAGFGRPDDLIAVVADLVDAAAENLLPTRRPED